MTFLLSSLGCFGGAVESYAATVKGIDGLLACWRLSTTSALVDETAGARNGTYTGTVTIISGLPADSDGAVDFAGIGQGSVAHDAGLALSAFTLSFWFRVHSHPEAPFRAPLISKDQAGFADGDFNVTVEDDGSVRVQAQLASGSQSFDLFSGEIETDVPHHMVVRADSTGLDAFLNGQYLGKQTGFTLAWSTNTQPLRFADVPWSAIDGNCVLDEVALYDRVLTAAEVFALAQLSGIAPVATNDSVNIPESQVSVIDVLANDSFVGAPTITIESQPGGGDSVDVSPDNKIEYTAGAVAAHTQRSFTYSIDDAFGSSNTATVSVTVADTSAPPSDQANCYVISNSDVVDVSSMSALQSAVNAAPPGRQIRILPGTYPGGSLTLDPRGTAGNPIVIRPRDGRGTVTLNGGAWTLAEESSYCVIADLYSNNWGMSINGSHHRVTRCRFRNVDKPLLNVLAATDIRIDHCDVSEYGPGGIGSNFKRWVSFDRGSITSGVLKRILVDYNYVHDVSFPGIPGPDTFAWVCHGGSSTLANGEIVYDHMLVRNFSGQAEFINMKASGYKVRFCTFENVNGYLQQRSGGGWECRSCWFENMGGDMKCFDQWGAGFGPQLIIGNRIIGGAADVWIGSGNSTEPDQGGVTPFYHRSRQGRFIGNIISGQFQVGQFHSSQTPIHPALNNNFHDNQGPVVNVFAQGTTFNVDNEPYVPAVKLTPSDVGLAAPDPLCPSGPQS